MDRIISRNSAIDTSSADEASDRSTRDIRAIISAIAQATIEIAEFVAFDGHMLRADGAGRIDLDVELAPARRAQTTLVAALEACAVRDVISASGEERIKLDPEGIYSVALDALDGARNIDTNMPLGTIFSVSFTGDGGTVRSGTMQLAAGFVVYGPQTRLVLTYGDGVDVYTLDRGAGAYKIAARKIQIPATSNEYAIDSSNYRHWPTAVRGLIDDHRQAADEPGASTFNMRWIGSLVAEAYRIIVRGGVFLCPPIRGKAWERGRQRLLTAAHPIAFIIEQAGGAATTGHERILDRASAQLDARTSFIFGSRDTVERIERLHALPESLSDASPLFGRRGLFRI